MGLIAESVKPFFTVLGLVFIKSIYNHVRINRSLSDPSVKIKQKICVEWDKGDKKNDIIY